MEGTAGAADGTPAIVKTANDPSTVSTPLASLTCTTDLQKHGTATHSSKSRAAASP
jgi:hypothetical protein